MQITKEEIRKFLRQNVHGSEKKELDYEESWTILNGLMISYLKANGDYNMAKEESFREGIKRVVLSLPKYAFGFKASFKLNIEDKEYFALCPTELAEGLTYKDINEEKVVEIAQTVIDTLVEKGVTDEGKMAIPDRKVSEATMEEFMETDRSLELMYDQILATRGEDALLMAIEFYKKQAEKAVLNEIELHEDVANYVAKFYSTILVHAKEDESGSASI